MLMDRRVFLVVASLLGVSWGACAPPEGSVSADTWTPPLGIPAPDFGITQQAPPAPSPWTAEVPGFYYVDEMAPAASDSRIYGHPSAPRATIPLRLPAGSVVEVHGTYSRSHLSPNVVVVDGTAAAPVFVRGSNATTRPVLSRPLLVRGSYFVVENLSWQLVDKTQAFKIVSPADHGALRHSDLQGNLGGGGIGIGYVASLGGVVANVVIWDNKIHDVGDVSTTYDQDANPVTIGTRVSNVWVLDNEIHDSSGSGVVVNAGSKAEQPNTHHVYFGRNHVYRTRQSGLFAKQAVDVIISENKVHDVIDTSWSPSKGLGFQYAPDRVWFLYNEVYNCSYGIYSGSDSGMGIGKDTYHIGNVIHGIHHVRSYNPKTAWSNAAIMLAGGVNRYVVGNTIYDADAGILSPGTAGAMVIVDNIVSNITQPEGAHIFVENGHVSSASSIHHNLLDRPVRIKWGNNTVRALQEFQQAFATQGAGSLDANPLFVDPAGANFELLPASPAIDRGVPEAAYATYQALYGIDISKDKAGRSRPQGAGWDIGAYEAQAAGPK
jgi:hypothetical protein